MSGLVMGFASLQAKDLGRWGEVFAIHEKDMMQMLQDKLKAHPEFWMKKQQEWQNQARQQLHHPTPVKGLKRTQQAQEVEHDPTFTLPFDLKDHHNRVLFPKGYKVNPLHHYPLTSRLVFVDGADEEQVAFLKTCQESDKIVLVNGDPLSLEEKLKKPIYFDQKGYLCQHFNLSHVPAIVGQKGDTIAIQYHPPKNKQGDKE